MYNDFIDKNSVEKKFIKSLENLEQNLDKVQLAISSENNYLQKNSYQLIASLMTGKDKAEKILFNELLNTCFQLEIKCQGSSFYFLKAFLSFAKEYSKKENITYSGLVEDNQIEGQKYLLEILKVCKPASALEIENLIDSITQDKIISSIVKEATNLAGIEGNIVVEEHELPNTIIDLQFGYNFKINPFKGFMPSFGTWTRSNLKILLVDGLVDKVSELDKILSKSFETKIPLLIIAQGFSEEIIATLHSNNTRGNFDIMPVRLEQSLEALNLLNDMAVVSGCDIVSSLKGEMLTFVNYDSLPTVEKISLTNDVITIHNNKTRSNVLGHLQYLQGRRKSQEENTSISDLSDLTTKRIQNLLAHIVKISIAKKDANKFKGKIDNAIRACRSIYTYGFCQPEKININKLNPEWKKTHHSMTHGSASINISSISLYLASNFAANMAASYFTASGAILEDESAY